jgi:purine-cytosine permease-like protein
MDRFARLAARMDQLYEYDREPVREEALEPGRHFASLFAGEHVAATEFVIGAFFVLHGVGLRDLAVGLLLGNLLAVLSWTFVCAPIATDTRLTLYWYLRKIAGPGFALVYNAANAVLYCVLAGAMIAVSATALGPAFGIGSPGFTDFYPASAGWVALTVVIGTAFTLFAILGFEKLARFAGICSPWIFVAFLAGAVASLPKLGVAPDLSNLGEIARTRIWTGVATAGQEKFGLGHILFFAWFANLAMHVGLSDMALFRYAKHWRYGLYSAVGMYSGHMLAWMCSGVMVAAIGREMDPGRMAYQALGVAGAFAVFFAGWTTANPTLYRAGLALQAVTGWARWRITLAAGALTTAFSCFPVVFLKLLDYVAIYGLVLMPVGAVVFAEHRLFPLLGIPRYRTESEGALVNLRAALVWAATLLACYFMPLHLFYRWLPGYGVALVGYTALALSRRRT